MSNLFGSFQGSGVVEPTNCDLTCRHEHITSDKRHIEKYESFPKQIRYVYPEPESLSLAPKHKALLKPRSGAESKHLGAIGA